VTPLPLMSVGAPDFVHGLRIFLTSLPLPDAMASASLLGYTKTEMSRGIDLLNSLAGKRVMERRLDERAKQQTGDAAPVAA